MRKKVGNKSIKKKLTRELDWYTLCASQEEYDEKAVESILYLLDTWDPLEEGTVPSADEAWERFQANKEKKEFLPVGKTASDEGVSLLPGADEIEEFRKSMALQEETAPKSAASLPSEKVRIPMKTGSPGSEKHCRGKKAGKFALFVFHHKVIAAAVFALVVLMVGNTINAVANPETGFFFWMERDDSGVKMMTVPEGLEETTEVNENIFYSSKDLPEWTDWWVQLEDDIQISHEYDFQYYEIGEFENRELVMSHYLNTSTKKEISLGVWVYLDKISYSIEEFIGYTYIESYQVGNKQMDIFSREEDLGKIYYIVCFYEENCKYFIRGQENLDELKVLIEIYWNFVK